MTFKTKWTIGIAIVTLALSACTADSSKPESNDAEQMDHSTMNHSNSGELPATLKNAEHPKFPIGSTAIITDGHMDGMKGAEATIVGAYNTTAYSISYTPTTGGAPVKNHKWVIHEELINPDNTPLAPGTKIKTSASHIAGMEDATVVIDTAVETTVYMVDYTDTATGENVKNHQWVTEEELTAK
ncbi:YdhK family protein [Lysinibacillus piscis]|uniref:DUF1541 domain-containing protein n=1 Tax=Lysinibacillus piscis TaxID=2518931 RepID=A0ABQ5NPD5_9BACI|nr:YdhK family protein [Lysinibacillus sp. KH24]GLC90237.1 hypothetical protein LYSBPC_33640 [Lysinibacillus sp. KH24]